MDFSTMRAYQNKLAASISHNDAFNIDSIRYIAGVDISWSNLTGGVNDNSGVAVIIVMTYPELKTVEEKHIEFETKISYKSGFLGFREVPQYIKLLNLLKIKPDIIMVDGFGILHPVGVGSASMLGIESNLSTIGVGKTINIGCCDQADKEIKAEMCEKNLLEISLVYNKKLVGKAIKKTHQYKQPVYVSIGHNISLDTALEIVKKTMIHKIPEPIRQADIISRSYLRNTN